MSDAKEMHDDHCLSSAPPGNKVIAPPVPRDWSHWQCWSLVFGPGDGRATFHPLQP